MSRPFHQEPLFSIQDKAVLSRFLNYFGIIPENLGAEQLAGELCRAFASLPYENLTKIVKQDDVLNPGSAKRLPDEVLRSFLEQGTGGTCFSLTCALVSLLSECGIEAYPLLADRRYGPDTHCGILLPRANGFYVADPGFLLFTPVPLPLFDPARIATPFNTVILTPLLAGTEVELATEINRDRTYRLTYKIRPVEASEFAHAWERSFGWEMMTYPVLTRVSAGAHHYLQGNELKIRRNGTKPERLTLEGEALFSCIVNDFNIAPEMAKKALEVLKYG